MIEEHKMRGDTTALQGKILEWFLKSITEHHKRRETVVGIF
jgi:hypothetical protein